jgi:hypothetical protein
MWEGLAVAKIPFRDNHTLFRQEGAAFSSHRPHGARRCGRATLGARQLRAVA